MKIIFSLLSIIVILQAGNYSKVKISPTVSYVYTKHLGQRVKIHRIQNTNNKLGGDYIKRYHPDALMQPVKIHQDIHTIAEIELLKFIENKNNHAINNILIDVRTQEQYQKETIPSSININVSIFENKDILQKLYHLLGINTKKVKNLIVFCDGIWSNNSKQFINILLENKYPASKIYYYRGGLQMWKILGFTTISSTKVKEK